MCRQEYLLLLVTLATLQKQLHGNDTDTVDKYWSDDGEPYPEDKCTDLLIEDIERLSPVAGLRRVPQADMPKGKRADIAYWAGNAMYPVEAKGQWNPDLRTAAIWQLDGQYLRDWNAQDLGLYLVYWFGLNVPANRQLKKPPENIDLPQTPAELKRQLEDAIPVDRRGAITVVVLDFTRL